MFTYVICLKNMFINHLLTYLVFQVFFYLQNGYLPLSPDIYIFEKYFSKQYCSQFDRKYMLTYVICLKNMFINHLLSYLVFHVFFQLRNSYVPISLDIYVFRKYFSIQYCSQLDRKYSSIYLICIQNMFINHLFTYLVYSLEKLL